MGSFKADSERLRGSDKLQTWKELEINSYTFSPSHFAFLFIAKPSIQHSTFLENKMYAQHIQSFLSLLLAEQNGG